VKRVRFHDSPVLNIQMPTWRARLVLILIMLGFVALSIKALYLQGISTQFLQQQGERRFERTLVLPPTRGKIFDRTGNVVLATSVPAKAIWAIPDDAKEATPEQLAELGKLLDMSGQDIQSRISGDDKNFVYLKRQVSVSVGNQIRQLRIPGIHELTESRRMYPEGDIAAHVLGFTNIEGNGLEGVELAYNSELEGRPGSRRVIRDRLGRIVEDVRAVVPPVNGQDLNLSIDAGIQFDTYTALKQTMEDHKAKSAAAVVIDVQTGEILAMVSLPSYDPNDVEARKGPALRNRAVVDTFEPGSIMKPFTAALALELGRITTKTIFHTGNGVYRYQGATIHDVEAGGNGDLNVAGVLRLSSNIGMTMISALLTSKEMWTEFAQLGIGRAPRLHFPGVATGRLRPWERWRPIERATMAYGYGLSVSLLQIAHAYTAFARNGDMVSLTLLKRHGAPTTVQAYSPRVAGLIRAMLEAAAGPDGAKQAQVQGYRVAGKTGTARQIIDGRYSKLYRGSFVGFAPVSHPRIVVGVTVDQPTVKGYYGAQVAAPAFSRIVTSCLRRMGVQPDAPMASEMALGPGKASR
jgi:cell division protein FtsI (penicillin-binding protein 3)